ncbi:HAD family hydrolase [Kitasatospora sp. NPDC058263]
MLSLAGFPAAEVARKLGGGLLAFDEQILAICSQTDPLAMLRLIANIRPDLTEAADGRLAELEMEAIRVSQPNADGKSVLQACSRSGRLVSEVSNNATVAIEAYLSGGGLRDLVTGVFGGTPGDPSSMKPNPRLLLEAMEAVETRPHECGFIGDAVRDVEAGNAASVPTIGYANKPGKDSRLAAVGAVLVADSMQLIADGLI